MSTKEDWLMRPILRGLCRYESIKDGTLDLVDFARMNEALDVMDHNEMALDRALEANRKRD